MPVCTTAGMYSAQSARSTEVQVEADAYAFSTWDRREISELSPPRDQLSGRIRLSVRIGSSARFFSRHREELRLFAMLGLSPRAPGYRARRLVAQRSLHRSPTKSEPMSFSLWLTSTQRERGRRSTLETIAPPLRRQIWPPSFLSAGILRATHTLIRALRSDLLPIPQEGALPTTCTARSSASIRKARCL